jgi:aminoglycoside phosphotransferase (APT) family kinase protein
MATEALLLERAGRGGVPVPELVATSAGDGPAGVQCLVSTRLPGEALPTRLFRDERYAAGVRRLTTDAASALAAIHRLDADGLALSKSADPVSPHRSVLDFLGESRPVLELAYRWLAANHPPATPGGDRVLHGDFRLGNLLVDEGGLRAVLDWELAHLGDPLEDLGWSMIRAWRFDAARPAGVFPDRETWIGAYEQASGLTVNRAALAWWEIAATYRWAVICLVQAHRHLGGQTSSVELATIGRRVFECEWDLLGLLALADPIFAAARLDDAGADPSAAPTAGAPPPETASHLHGTSTVGILVAAVRDVLAGPVVEATSGSVRHQARVAANALGIVARELELRPQQVAAHAQRLAELGVSSDAELAQLARTGETGQALVRALALDTRDRLLVANPGWLNR